MQHSLTPSAALNVSERRLAPPTVAVSTVIFTLDRTQSELPRLFLPLVRRTRPPFKGQWALPGGPLGPEDSLVSAAHGDLAVMTGVSPSYLEQLYTFGDLARSPAERTVSIVYWALVPASARRREEENVRWFDADQVGELAFDHNRIVEYALQRLRTKMTYADIAYRFLGPTFTLAQVREVFEAVLGRRVDPGNFRRRLQAESRIVATEEFERQGAHRPARLYRYLEEG